MALSTPADQDIVVVGASGALAARRLLPALYNLEREGLLPERGNVVGTALNDWADNAFGVYALKSIAFHSRTGLDDSVWDRFSPRLRFVPSRDGGSNPMANLEAALTQDRRLVYLSIPPSAIAPVTMELGEAGLAGGTSPLLQKPFGHRHASEPAPNA